MMMTNSGLKFVSWFLDRHGKKRWRFRRAPKSYYFQGDFGTPEFAAEYVSFLNGGVGAGYGAKPIRFDRTDISRTAAFVETMHAQADAANTASLCYFIGAEHGCIKIGQAGSVASRLAELQPCSPLKLRVMATRSGGVLRETAYHVQFGESRSHGEWFERTPELLAEIDRLNPLAAREGRI